MTRKSRDENRRFAIALARGGGGAVVFSLPLLMTAEMWEIGATIPPGRLLLLLVASFPLLAGLSHVAGFEDTNSLLDDAVDAAVALGIGLVAAVPLLWLFGVIDAAMPLHEIVGKVTLQSVPGAIGALLARSQLHESDEDQAEERRRRESSYAAELFTMLIGSLFLALNIAPTEEVTTIAGRLSEWQLLGLMAVSLLIMHGFVYGVEFRGQARPPEGTSVLSLAIRFTAPGYVLGLLISLLVLWVFGRTQGLAPEPLVAIVLVLGLPAAIGAAAARLIL